jgi:signal transduction histidine kinase
MLGDTAGIVFAVLIALLAAADAADSGRVTGEALFYSLLLALAGCVALVWRRRHPVGVALLLVPMVALTELVGGAALVAVYTVAATRRWAVTVAVAVLHVLAPVPYTVLVPDAVLGMVGVNALNVTLIAVAIAIGAVVRARRESVAALRERAAHAEAEVRATEERLRQQEREQIAREMHDVLAHRISLVSLHAGALEVRPDLSREEISRTAATIRASAHQALEDLREILGVLRAGTGFECGGQASGLRPQPGLDDLPALVAECRSTGTDVEVDDRLAEAVPPSEPPASVSRTAYRIVQEGLTNARKHAPGAPVHVLLDRTDAGELHVWLQNGLARPRSTAIPGARAGLVGLAERARLAGGRIDHGVRLDRSGLAFHLEAWLPWTA